MKRRHKILMNALKKWGQTIIPGGLSISVSALIFYLYHLPFEPLIYAAVMVSFTEILCFFILYSKERSRGKEREQMIYSMTTQYQLPSPTSLEEEDYGEAIRCLQQTLIRLENETATLRQDEVDYYTTWVHQIKTPISVMRMTLGQGDNENTHILETELFRIEQYVNMVLTYIRLGSSSHDLVVKNNVLDDLIRETIRKFASQFVIKRLRLNYEGTDLRIITDKKWFICILEQLLSNAIKYTPSGCISIVVESETLKITDTGIGIAPEDLPRIFEKGYTGFNGRLDQRASGLGLYLSKKAADLLTIPLSVSSIPGKGSTFSLELAGKVTVR